MVVAALFASACACALAAAPTDPRAAEQQPLSIMRVGEALDHVGPGLSDVPVLTADTGLAMDNPDIAPRLFSMPADTPAPDPDNTGNPGTVAAGSHGWDLIGTDGPGALAPDADPSDSAPDGGHGTLVAGLLGGAWNNGQGGAGVAPNARFLALRTCWGGDQCYQYVQASAFNWAADRGVRVVSMSWLSDPALEAEFASAITSHPNVLFVAIPSGNGGAYDVDDPAQQQANSGTPDPPMPCALHTANVLCVSTSSPTDGLDCGAYGAQSVDVAVPTENNVTTTRDGGFTTTGCATSFAAPTAAGLATILFGIDPTASASDVRQAIIDSARKVPAWDGKSVSGGVADAVAAVDLFQSRRGIAGRMPSTPAPGPVPGPTPPVTLGPAPDKTAPALSFSVSPKSFRAGDRRARFVVKLDEAAGVRISVKRLGSRARARVVTKSLPAGSSRVKPGRLAPGRYRATAVATDAARNASPPRRATFRVR